MTYRDLSTASNILVIQTYPTWSIDERQIILDLENGDWKNPSVLQYKRSYIGFTADRWISRDFTTTVLCTVQIPHHNWTPEEPWFDKISLVKRGKILILLRAAMDFIDLAETYNYKHIDKVLLALSRTLKGDQ